METGDVVRLVLLGIVLVLSAFFSTSEAAYLAVRRGKLAAMVQRGERGADRAAKLGARPERLLPTVLTGNNLANVAAASLGTALAASFLSPNWAVPAATGGVTVLLLVFTETTPKTIASNNAERIAILTGRPIRAAEFLFFPAVWLLERFSSLVVRILGTARSTSVTEEEIRSLIDVAEDEGVLQPSEADMLERVFHFGDRQVHEVMTPRTDIVWVGKGTNLQDFLNIYAGETHTRFPVFEGDHQNVVGILSVKDLLEAMAQGRVQPNDSVTEVLRPAYYVPETKLVAQLFEELRGKGQQMAIIVDQHGSVSGLITLKRHLEIIVGPVGEEGEPAREEFVTTGENSYDVDAGMSIQMANEKLELNLPDGDYQTLAGFFLKQVGRIPEVGDHFTYGDMRMEVREMRRVKIERIEVRWLGQRVESAAT